MIIARTPFRLSLLGGGTDFPSWYAKHGGLVVGGAVNLYCYILARHLPPFHPYKTRVVYSKIEQVQSNFDIEHRAVNAVVHYLGLGGVGLEISHSADLPGRSGTGSSSSFVVGTLNALATLKGDLMLPCELMNAAVDIEQNALGETVGCQDQAFAAYGGLNTIVFHKAGGIQVFPLAVGAAQLADLEAHLLLLYTGITRTSSEVAATYASTLGERGKAMWSLMNQTETGIRCIIKSDWKGLGRCVDESWRIKCDLSDKVCPPEVAKMYATARVYGAFGGKLCGAGAGGMLMLVAPPESHQGIINALPGTVHVPFRFEFGGSRIIHFDREANG